MIAVFTIHCIFVKEGFQRHAFKQFAKLHKKRLGEIVFLAEGRRKASVVKKLIDSALPSTDFPAAMVHPRDGVLHWMLDSEAASLIR